MPLTFPTPQEAAAQRLARQQQTIRVSHSRLDDQITLSIRHRPWQSLTAQERCNLLAAISSEFRALAEQADEERLTIAEQELAA